MIRLAVGAALLYLPGCVAPRLPAPAPPRVAVSWSAVDGWARQDPTPALAAFRESCKALRNQPRWQVPCTAAGLDPPDAAAARHFFETYFTPYQLEHPDGTTKGLITGYYVPDLKGSRTRTDRYRYPIYGVPDDLVTIDLGSVYPELNDYRLRGRVEGRRVVPYYSREQIEDPVELFFLQVQGSGRIELDGGQKVMVQYADQNGYPYHSIGKLLLQRGEMTPQQMSLQGIKAWAHAHPKEVKDLLDENPSYVFFREMPAGVDRPEGALGVPLTAGRSLAVDPRFIPLGVPVFLSTTWPLSARPLRRLMVAQDTGGAIKGPVRGDFFWGLGDDAGEYAGKMKQRGRLWVLLPKAEPVGARE
jgi:membrane-bound lytic murein transglycosylase A